MRFRYLKANEIECRPATTRENGCSLLLYKNARCDMKILDETVTAYNWQRDHKELKGNMYAGIGIFCEERGEWVWKWDCGAESNTEAEKGEASDSFKRAGFNWGIGRELYTAPFIWITDVRIEPNGKGKLEVKDKFEVAEIECDDQGAICKLTIVNAKTKKCVFDWGSKEAKAKALDKAVQTAQAKMEMLKYINEKGMSKENVDKICSFFKVKSIGEMTEEQCRQYLAQVDKNGGKKDE